MNATARAPRGEQYVPVSQYLFVAGAVFVVNSVDASDVEVRSFTTTVSVDLHVSHSYYLKDEFHLTGVIM